MFRVARVGIVVIESRDSLAMRLAERFTPTPMSSTVVCSKRANKGASTLAQYPILCIAGPNVNLRSCYQVTTPRTTTSLCTSTACTCRNAFAAFAWPSWPRRCSPPSHLNRETRSEWLRSRDPSRDNWLYATNLGWGLLIRGGAMIASRGSMGKQESQSVVVEVAESVSGAAAGLDE